MADSQAGSNHSPVFAEEDIKAIARVLNDAHISKLQDHWHLKVEHPEEKRHLTIDIYPQASLSEKKQGALIAVYAQNSHLQLHECRGFVLSEELGEVTFVSNAGKNLSGMVIEREAACSLYANADRDLLSDDFTKLGVEVMLSGVALALAEDIISPE